MTTTPVQAGQPLLRELITIPERIHQGDFVLRLTEGVRDIQATLDSYVITPQLRVAFDKALGSSAQPLMRAGRRPATCTARSAPARATSWRCCTPC